MAAASLKHSIEPSGNCLSSDKLAEDADVSMHTHLASGTPRMLASNGDGRGPGHVASYGEVGVNLPSVASGNGRRRATVYTEKACYQCGSRDHAVNFFLLMQAC